MLRQFGSGVLGRELPVASRDDVASCCFPRLDLSGQSCHIRDASGEALSVNAEFVFGDIEPRPKFWELYIYVTN